MKSSPLKITFKTMKMETKPGEWRGVETDEEMMPMLKVMGQLWEISQL